MISSISIDKFGDIDSLQLQLKKFHMVDVSSGGASLLGRAGAASGPEDLG